MKALHPLTVHEAMSEQRNVHTITCYLSDGICYLSLGTTLPSEETRPEVSKKVIENHLKQKVGWESKGD